MISSVSILSSLLLVLVRNTYAHPMYDPRPRDPADLQELLMWSHPQPHMQPQPQFPPQPSRPEYEPAAYGYPDYGDYAEPRPAYSELDILREQLARSQPPFNKRLLPYETMGNGWEDVAEPPVPNAATWYDAEVPVPVANPPMMNANAAGLEALTEALLQVLTQQMNQRQNPQLAPSPYDSMSDEEQDPIVEELKETAVKKSQRSLPTTTTTTTNNPSSDSTATPNSQTSEEASTVHSTNVNENEGQKEVPLLRPPKPGKMPFFPMQAFALTGGNNNNRINIKRTMKKVMKPRSAFRRQMSSIITNDEDLTKQLNSLKKREP